MRKQTEVNLPPHRKKHICNPLHPTHHPRLQKSFSLSLFLPTLKKRINFLHSNPKNQPCRIDGTAYNKSFARLRGKVLNSRLLPIFEHWCLIESFGISSPQPRKAPNRYASPYETTVLTLNRQKE